MFTCIELNRLQAQKEATFLYKAPRITLFFGKFPGFALLACWKEKLVDEDE